MRWRAQFSWAFFASISVKLSIAGGTTTPEVSRGAGTYFTDVSRFDSAGNPKLEPVGRLDRPVPRRVAPLRGGRGRRGRRRLHIEGERDRLARATRRIDEHGLEHDVLRCGGLQPEGDRAGGAARGLRRREREPLE